MDVGGAQMRRTLTAVIATLGVIAVMLLVSAASASAAQNFTTPVQLSNPPVGGEPSIATDSYGDVFVGGPQGIPSGLSGVPGIGFWISRDDGNTFAKGKFIGSYLGGGDDDVINDQNTIYVTDLEAAGAEVCKSTDRGNTFTGVGPVATDQCNTIAPFAQTAPSDDRPWLAADPTDKQRIYEVYHEFITAQPLAFRTDNGGADSFINSCGSLVSDPAIEANIPTDVTGGTLVARPVVGKDGTLYVLFATTTQQENAQAFSQGFSSGTFSQLYLAVSHDRCQSFTDYTVFDGQAKYGMNDVQFGDIFNDLAIDGGGNLYAVGAGAVGTKPFPTTTNVYVLTSTDHGQHWSNPRMIDNGSSAHMLPAAIGGPKGGQLAIGYFRTTNGITDPNSTSGKWTYTTAESTNATASAPAYTYRDVRPGYVYHNGQICNAGVLCGAPGQPSDRSLLDFTSAALDTHNCPLFTFAGNPTGSADPNASNANSPSNTNNFVTRQLVGCFATKATTSTKKKHHKKHKKHKTKKKKHHHVKAARRRRLPAFTG
jgi:hypothetical protein